jgi:ATP-dependent Clp protease ATP-binding subunit ClpB
LLADRKLTIELTPEAKRVIAEEGYDPAFGARPLKRAVQRLLQNPLAMQVLEGRFHEGDRIRVTVKPGGSLAFERAEPAVMAGR